jgi:hypothetical protein
MFNMPLVDMAKTPEEVKEEIANDNRPSTAATNGSSPKVPVYPYGLCLSLEDESLEKLKLDGALPPVGATIFICGEARVTSASSSEREGPDGKKTSCNRVELQFTRMGVPAPDLGSMAVAASEMRQSKWYGHSEPDGDE